MLRGLIALIVIIYLVGVGVALAPTIQANWSTATAAEFASKVGQDVPYALAWPAWVFRRIADRGEPKAERS